MGCTTSPTETVMPPRSDPAADTAAAEQPRRHSCIPDNPDKFLTRAELAAAFDEMGIPTPESTLATWAVRGGGPPMQNWGSRVRYQWGPALKWAKGRLSKPRSTTSEPIRFNNG